jgi:hypothetical protein
MIIIITIRKIVLVAAVVNGMIVEDAMHLTVVENLVKIEISVVSVVVMIFIEIGINHLFLFA